MGVKIVAHTKIHIISERKGASAHAILISALSVIKIVVVIT